jgi:hypothetical protein
VDRGAFNASPRHTELERGVADRLLCFGRRPGDVLSGAQRGHDARRRQRDRDHTTGTGATSRRTPRPKARPTAAKKAIAKTAAAKAVTAFSGKGTASSDN